MYSPWADRQTAVPAQTASVCCHPSRRLHVRPVGNKSPRAGTTVPGIDSSPGVRGTNTYNNRGLPTQHVRRPRIVRAASVHGCSNNHQWFGSDVNKPAQHWHAEPGQVRRRNRKRFSVTPLPPYSGRHHNPIFRGRLTALRANKTRNRRLSVNSAGTLGGKRATVRRAWVAMMERRRFFSGQVSVRGNLTRHWAASHVSPENLVLDPQRLWSTFPIRESPILDVLERSTAAAFKNFNHGRHFKRPAHQLIWLRGADPKFFSITTPSWFFTIRRWDRLFNLFPGTLFGRSLGAGVNNPGGANFANWLLFSSIIGGNNKTAVPTAWNVCARFFPSPITVFVFFWPRRSLPSVVLFASSVFGPHRRPRTKIGTATATQQLLLV